MWGPWELRLLSPGLGRRSWGGGGAYCDGPGHGGSGSWRRCWSRGRGAVDRTDGPPRRWATGSGSGMENSY